MHQPTSILIADDQALYREGLCEIISRWDDFKVIGEVENGQEAVEFCRKRKPDLVLMDIKMPVMDGLTALSVITAELPETIIVMLSVYEGEHEVISALRNGARGYVLKNTYSRQFHHRLRCVVGGECTLSEEAATRCVDYIRRDKVQEHSAVHMPGDIHLTEHERALLAHIAIGASNKEIGDALYISESTVKKQISFLLSKLNLDNRVQAAVFAIRTGIVA